MNKLTATPTANGFVHHGTDARLNSDDDETPSLFTSRLQSHFTMLNTFPIKEHTVNDPSRRDAMKFAAGGMMALLGTSALGTSPAAAASQDGAGEGDSRKLEPSPDHQRVVAAGMTEDEATCWDAVADAAGRFFALPELHAMDAHEVAQAIHIIQHKLLARPTYRKYLELAKAAAEAGEGN